MNATLDNKMIDFGASLITALDQQQIVPDAAFWLYLSEIESWKLIISLTKVGTVGPKDIYKTIRKILNKDPQIKGNYSLEDISLVTNDSYIVKLLRSAIRTGTGISSIRFTRNVINGILIEDAYIYRI